MIEILDVRKRFDDQEVLKGIDLVIKNETVGLLGANGAGKTTLLKCILNLLDFEGRVMIAGVDVRKEPCEAKRRIGYIPQYFPLWSNLTVAEAMRFVGKLRQIPDQRGRALLEEFGLATHKEKPIAALSGGMRQKLSIAIALLPDPEVLLLDEPTASLDAWATLEILRIFESWRGKRTVLLSSHRIEEVKSVSSRLVQIKNGVIVDPGSEILGGLAVSRPKGILCAQ